MFSGRLWAHFGWCLATGMLLAARGDAPRPAPRGRSPLGSGLASVRRGDEVARPRSDDSCAARWRELTEAPALPGVPELEAVRAEVVGRARAAPVLFLEPPLPELPSARVAPLRARLFSEAAPWAAFAQVYEELRSHPEELRAALLSDAYLYATTPALAALLANGVRLEHLFREPMIIVERGDRRLRARRSQGAYVWLDGPERGETARLWLFDRVAVGPNAVFGPARHVALGGLLEELGASSLEVVRLTRGGVLAKLRYGDVEVPAVLVIEGARLVLECQSVPEATLARMLGARETARRVQRVLGDLRAQIDAQVAQALPFDEPKTEEGQQDGKLRPEWRTAYLNGQSHYTFNGDRYPVFDAQGRPRPPQVCVDFILDTWERMSGTRWLSRDEGRGRRQGRLDFGGLGIENRRSVEQFIEFARAHPDWFELYEVPEAERVAFSNRRRFFQRLTETPDRFQPGDVVAILGPRDDERLHYHSFFVVDRDPISGVPTLLAANAGRPRFRNWEGELENAPRRAIVARIRPRLAWLEGVAGVNDPKPEAPGTPESPSG